MLKRIARYGLFCLLMLAFAEWSAAQGGLNGLGNRMRGFSSRGGGGSGDSLQHRTGKEDSITINFRYLDSSRNYTFDSSISDYSTRFPIPPTHVYLGNVGTASHSLLFAPTLRNGFDPGFHAFDVYKITPDDVRFYNTTRPYTELGYVLGSRTQQIIDVVHTQNIKPYWNVGLRYRMINIPGFFQNQKANHNNYLLHSWYQSPKKRYNNYFILLSNALQVGENGGIIDTISLKNPDYAQRFDIPTKLGGNTAYASDLQKSALTTGNRYVETNFIMRQQYDFGRKDSLVSDSTVIPLFYPRLRFEHTFNYGKYTYKFQNTNQGEQNYLSDSAYYWNNYNIVIGRSDSLLKKDQWHEITNDFSIYQFPDAKNLQQYIKVGAMYQLLNGRFDSATATLHNIAVHGEYRNRTRNKKWDVLAYGNLYLNGYNAGDYHGYISLQRFLGRQWGSLELGFENVNRSPSFTYDRRSSFYMDTLLNEKFTKENTTHFFGTVYNPKLHLRLGADYYLISNYLYLTNFYDLRQENTIFNVLRVNAAQTLKLSRHLRLYTSLWLQQKAGNADVNLPFFYTRDRLAFEGHFFRNLDLSTGIEFRYNAPYDADAYSPVLGRFFYQNSVTINNRPEVDAFFNFRIRSFKAYIRAENLNSMSLSNGGFGFLNNNLAAPGYPYPGLVLRFGFYWSFVN